MTDLRLSYPDGLVVLDESHFMKDLSFHLWTFTGTNTGPGAAPPTGKSVKLTDSTLVRYQDGKIAEEVVYFDMLDWQTQLGYTLTPPASGEAPVAQ
jgi:predicted ester cyclase